MEHDAADTTKKTEEEKAPSQLLLLECFIFAIRTLASNWYASIKNISLDLSLHILDEQYLKT